MRILAVDDDEIALRLLEEALTCCEYKDVVFCGSGAEALEIILDDSNHFDCFLFDVQMPGMNGIDLCDEVRGLKKYSKTPIIMVTGMSEKAFVDQAFAAGATDYLTKPYAPLDVGARLGLVKELSGERRAVNESIDVIELLIKTLDQATRHDLETAIDLGRLDRVLSYPAFENYLSELSRGVFFLSSIFAVKIKGVEALHETLPPLEFKDVIRRSAKALADRLNGCDVFLTYRGNGTFVGAIPHKGTQAFEAMGDELVVAIHHDDSLAPQDVPDHVTLAVGDLVVTKILGRPGSIQNLKTAISSAEKKANQESLPPKASGINAFDGHWQPPEELGFQTECEELLKDALEGTEIQGNFPRVRRNIT
ncbi:response regulator [Aliiroseovarius subalbicans]|uniref:response regulator n=1 Tax=Aliiroseovarius subalbicans TaxID=2925840 RepID=UPI001F5952EE|nr:response regulator [uncultured Aliiroseovarius sp.]MCI2399240.1 response regulator [Aliiroseovarius subalbicans]